MANKKLNPVHPGEVLFDKFLKPMEISQNRLARDIGVSPRRVNEIVLGKRSVTADTAIRFARHFDMNEEFWMNLQSRYELDLAKEKIGKRLKKEVKIRNAPH